MPRPYRRTVRTIPIDTQSGTARVPLSNGLEAIIDAADTPIVEGHNWHAFGDVGRPGNHTHYARTNARRPDGSRHPVPLHHMLLGKPPKGMVVDFVNGNGLDCRRSNMRFATRAQDSQNYRKPVTNTSGAKGVSEFRGRYVAQIRAFGPITHLGLFGSVEEAARAYDAAARDMHGAFARTNAAMRLLSAGEDRADFVQKSQPVSME